MKNIEISIDKLDIRLEIHDAEIVIDALEVYQEYLEMRKEETKDLQGMVIMSAERYEKAHQIDLSHSSPENET